MKTLQELQPYCKKNFRFEDIVRIEAIENYSKLTQKDGRIFIFARTLGNYESNLGLPFLRVNRSCMVNIHHLPKKVFIENSRIKLEDGNELTISRRRLEKVTKTIDSFKMQSA
jgi:DNA-binding LytR/AlgR family response regulator